MAATARVVMTIGAPIWFRPSRLLPLVCISPPFIGLGFRCFVSDLGAQVSPIHRAAPSSPNDMWTWEKCGLCPESFISPAWARCFLHCPTSGTQQPFASSLVCLQRLLPPCFPLSSSSLPCPCSPALVPWHWVLAETTARSAAPRLTLIGTHCPRSPRSMTNSSVACTMEMILTVERRTPSASTIS